MNCSNCGAPNQDGIGIEFCGSCGARLTPNAVVSGGQATPIARELRPMGVGDMFDETIRLFRQNFRTFIGIVAVLQVPLVIFQLIQFGIGGESAFGFPLGGGSFQPRPGQADFLFISNGVIQILNVVAFLAIEGALAAAISERYLGRSAGIRESYQVVRRFFWRILGSGALAGVLIVLLTITIVGIPFAIMFSIRWALILQAVVLEGKKVRESLSRSSGLVKGTWWRVLGVLLVAGIAQYLVVGIPSGIIGLILGGVGGLLFPQMIVIFVIAAMAIAGIFQILAAPLVPTFTTLLYYDLRVRKEAYDLEVLAGRQAEPQP